MSKEHLYKVAYFLATPRFPVGKNPSIGDIRVSDSVLNSARNYALGYPLVDESLINTLSTEENPVTDSLHLTRGVLVRVPYVTKHSMEAFDIRACRASFGLSLASNSLDMLSEVLDELSLPTHGLL